MRVKRSWLVLVVVLAAAGLWSLARTGPAAAGVRIVTSSVIASDGTVVTATNHLVVLPAHGEGPEPPVPPHAPPPTAGAGQYLVVWAGDVNAADHSAQSAGRKVTSPQVEPGRAVLVDAAEASIGPDFLAVIDVNAGSPTYGKVVNTVTLDPFHENEPHHLQYVWHKGHKLYAGGLFSDMTFVFDVSKLPVVTLTGANLPGDTPCGSVPDAYWALSDGTAYGTYMGGPNLPGPCQYTNGEVRVGNGFGGTPGSLVRIGPDGKTLAEVPAALATAEDPERCPALPAIPVASCANPHGIQLREDLNRMITTDYAEPKNVVTDPGRPLNPNLFRDTVRIWDIADRNNPKVVSVGVMPDGPRKERILGHEEPRGIMEGTVTNRPEHRGAFASSMCGGVIYYTPDITAAEPVWREVFDDTTAAAVLTPELTEAGGCDGGGWVQTSPDDRFLFHAVIGRNPGSTDPADKGMPKMVYVLDIRNLLAAGPATTCSIDTIQEVWRGGREPDCPKVAGVIAFRDETSGGPHWGAMDNFEPTRDGRYRETATIRRIAVSNYFVARSSVDGDHKVCMVNVGRDGALSLDTTFLDENHGTPCVDFNRNTWPHGDYGSAKPHSELFVVSDELL